MSVFTTRQYQVAAILVHIDEIGKDLGKAIPDSEKPLLAELIAAWFDPNA